MWIELTNQEMGKAYELANELPEVMKYNRSGNTQINKMAGRMGEIAWAKYLKAQHVDDFEYDLVHNGKRIEVKTMVRTVAPRLNFSFRIAIHEHVQDCDLYAFASVETYDITVNGEKRTKFKKGVHLCGWVTKEESLQWPQVKKGDPWPTRPEKRELGDAYINEIATFHRPEALQNEA